MNWDAVGAIGEVVGALAVLATLIYFSLQIRSMHASVRGDAVSRAQEIEFKLLELELRYAPLIVKANEGTSLSSEESAQLLKLYRSRWTGHLLEFIRSKSIGLNSRAAARNFARSLTENDSYMNLYKDRPDSPDPNVIEFIEMVNYYLERGVV